MIMIMIITRMTVCSMAMGMAMVSMTKIVAVVETSMDFDGGEDDHDDHDYHDDDDDVYIDVFRDGEGVDDEIIVVLEASILAEGDEEEDDVPYDDDDDDDVYGYGYANSDGVDDKDLCRGVGGCV